MAMVLAPAAKRRRLEYSAPDESDDDELSFLPEEVSNRRDPDYQLTMQRASAEYRLQSTMESIFDKYGQDFEGIGDEIDMMTGEMVVNNGHLERELLPGQADDEDFMLSGKRAPEASDEDEDEDEDDRIMNGRDPSSSTALVSTRGNAQLRKSASMSSLFPHPPGSGLLGFGPPSLPFETSPFAFGASPLAMGPWGMPDDYSNPSPMGPDFCAIGSRFDFPMRDNHMALSAPRAAKVAKTILGPWRKTILATARRRRERDDEDDDDTILTGKKTKGKKKLENRDVEASEEEDDLLLAGSEETIITKRPAHRLPAGRTTSKDIANHKNGAITIKRKRRSSNPPESSHSRSTKASLSLVAKPQMQLVVTKMPKWPILETDLDSSDCRRSGRARRQVEYMGKISWAEALAAQRKTQTKTLEIRPRSAGQLGDHERVDEVIGDEFRSPSTRSLSPTSDVTTSAVVKALRAGVVPNSQDSLTPLPSSDPDPAASDSRAKEDTSLKQPEENPYDIDSACFLSDEETPTMLSRPRRFNSRKSHTNLPHSSSLPRLSAPETSVATELPDEEHASGPAEHTASDPPAEEVEDHRPIATFADKPRRLVRELRRLQKLAASSSEVQRALAHDSSYETDASKKHLRSTRSKDKAIPISRDGAVQLLEEEEEADQSDLPQVEDDPFALPEDPVLPSPAPSASPTLPTKATPKRTPSKPALYKQTSSPTKPQTPRHAILKSPSKAPSSRRSVLSLLSDDDDEEDDYYGDELGRRAPAAQFNPHSSGATRRIWKPSARTTEVYRTPVKKGRAEPPSPGSVVKTPGGTLRTCGVDAYRCGRDFCFTCL